MSQTSNMPITSLRWLHEEFSLAYWQERGICPVLDGKKLDSLMISPESDLRDVNHFRYITGERFRFEVTEQSSVLESLTRLSQQELSSVSTNGNGTRTTTPDETVSSSVIATVNEIIRDAVRAGASDIHFEPFETILLVRVRVDGSLREDRRLDVSTKAATISRLKIMGGLDIAERRLPQDGRIRFHMNGNMIDLRLSTLPTEFGEKAVLRILDKSSLRLDLDSLGMNDSQLVLFRRNLRRSNGIILVTGPTGSGKTTTLYSALNEILSPELNITTIEDPIEYNLEGVNQTQIKPEIGLDFAQALRSILRQDPNVIMVGEIRDSETLSIALRSALTGHLVLSTLHTNDSVSAVTRLVDLKAERSLLATGLRLIIAQRLVRALCANCKKQANDDLEYRAVGCEQCYGSGYSGRKAVFEFLEITEEFSAALESGATSAELSNLAKKDGLVSLYDSGMELIKQGVTDRIQLIKEIA